MWKLEELAYVTYSSSQRANKKLRTASLHLPFFSAILQIPSRSFPRLRLFSKDWKSCGKCGDCDLQIGWAWKGRSAEGFLELRLVSLSIQGGGFKAMAALGRKGYQIVWNGVILFKIPQTLWTNFICVFTNHSFLLMVANTKSYPKPSLTYKIKHTV